MWYNWSSGLQKTALFARPDSWALGYEAKLKHQHKEVPTLLLPLQTETSKMLEIIYHIYGKLKRLKWHNNLSR